MFTIFWEYGAKTQKILWSNLRIIKNGLIDTGIKVAIDVADQFSPSWVAGNRGSFVIESIKTEVDSLIARNDWDKLSECWLPYTKSKNNSLRSKAEFDMALASEMNGDVDTALQWAVKSRQSSYRYQTDYYIKKLKQRKVELERIRQKLQEEKKRL